jgi:hypothetical protein
MRTKDKRLITSQITNHGIHRTARTVSSYHGSERKALSQNCTWLLSLMTRHVIQSVTCVLNRRYNSLMDRCDASTSTIDWIDRIDQCLGREKGIGTGFNRIRASSSCSLQSRRRGWLSSFQLR